MAKVSVPGAPLLRHLLGDSDDSGTSRGVLMLYETSGESLEEMDVDFQEPAPAAKAAQSLNLPERVRWPGPMPFKAGWPIVYYCVHASTRLDCTATADLDFYRRVFALIFTHSSHPTHFEFT